MTAVRNHGSFGTDESGKKCDALVGKTEKIAA